MKKILVLFLVIKCYFLIYNINASDDHPFKENWEAFKKTYGKNYSSPTEEQIRMKIFVENLQKIYNNNQIYEKGQTQYRMGLNQFADMPYSEFLDKVGKFRQSVQMDKFLQTWNSYKTKFGKNYTSEIEEKLRMMIFADNLRLLLEHNERYKKGEETYSMGMDYFTDMLICEMQGWKKANNKNSMNEDYEGSNDSSIQNEVITEASNKTETETS